MKEHHLPDNPDTIAAHYCDEYTINTHRAIATKTPSLRTKTPFLTEGKVERKLCVCDGVLAVPVVREAMTGGEVSPVAVCG